MHKRSTAVFQVAFEFDEMHMHESRVRYGSKEPFCCTRSATIPIFMELVQKLLAKISWAASAIAAI